MSHVLVITIGGKCTTEKSQKKSGADMVFWSMDMVQLIHIEGGDKLQRIFHIEQPSMGNVS